MQKTLDSALLTIVRVYKLYLGTYLLIYERLESFCTGGQGWEFSGNSEFSHEILSREAGSKQCRQ